MCTVQCTMYMHVHKHVCMYVCMYLHVCMYSKLSVEMIKLPCLETSNHRLSPRSRRGFSRQGKTRTRFSRGIEVTKLLDSRSRRGFLVKLKLVSRTRRVVWSPRSTALAVNRGGGGQALYNLFAVRCVHGCRVDAKICR